VRYSVEELVDIARALTEGDLEKHFGEHVRRALDELGSCLEAIRQTIGSSPSSAGHGYANALGSQGGRDVTAIHREAAQVFDSAWEVVEEMQMNQEMTRDLLGSTTGNLTAENVRRLSEVADRERQCLVRLMSHLSVYEVLRQRLEKVQLLIDQLDEKTTELMGKFNIKSNEQSTREGDREDPLRISDLNQSLVDQLLERLK
jgi:hypothetical protein